MKKLKNSNSYISEQHPFHMVDSSPWPIMTSISLLSFVMVFVMYFHMFKFVNFVLLPVILILCLNIFRWFSDIVVESTYEGQHTFKVQQGIRLGMCLFIISEVMFFFSFFWGYFHCSLAPSISIGYVWPPINIISLDAWGLPLLNTIILLSSGITITCVHKAILIGERPFVINSLIWTIFYGIVFSVIQGYEYQVSPFSINDSVFGSLFFMLTGFHGFHVFVGTIFLIVCLYRQINYHFIRKQHIGLECCIWYWHFVDVVWVLLFVIVYIWGG